MGILIKAFPLYQFLNYCNESGLEKKILDCGAGGCIPPLSLFYENDYETYGIELCNDQYEKALSFCEKNRMNLNILQGDMMKLTFEDEYFSFLYSYNTSVHILKKDFITALKEFKRVLKEGGLCYVNFLGEECDFYGEGREVGTGEFVEEDDGEAVFYVHYREEEIERLLSSLKFTTIYKEKRCISRLKNNKASFITYYDYILKK